MNGGWSIEKECFDKIIELTPRGGNILELGSGPTSGELSKHFNVWSIEHDHAWIGKYNTNYIYAPLTNNWYNMFDILTYLPEGIKFDLILVDGPPAGQGNPMGRWGFIPFSNMVVEDKTVVIVDDIQREEDNGLFLELAKIWGRTTQSYKFDKSFGVINKK